MGVDEGTWTGRIVLVTGAAGFLGRTVSRQLLASGATVLGVDIAWDDARASLAPVGLRRVDGDVRETAELARTAKDSRADTVIHLGAQTLVGPAVDDPADTFSHNIEGSWSVLEVCRANPAITAALIASSDKAYGDWAGRPYREDMALRARHPYDVSKAATDLLAQSYAATYGVPVGISRCGNLYGGGDLNWSRLVPGIIRSVLENERPIIRSDGTPVRDYLHVEDAADGVLKLAAHLHEHPDAKGRPFNFGGRNRLTAIDVATRILEMMGSGLEPDVRALTLPEIPHQRLAIGRARRELGWRPRIGFNRGIADTIAWYRANLGRVT